MNIFERSQFLGCRIFICLLLCCLTMGGLMANEESKRKELLTKYLRELIAMKTVTADRAANQLALEWVEKQLQAMPLHMHHYEFDGYHSLVVTTQETKAPKVLLAAHIDVVPAPDELFTAKVEGNKMYGRGSYDMKMAIACYLLLLQELKDELPQYDFGLMLTSDEEIGGMHGVQRLLEIGYSAQVVLLPDGGFNWRLERAAKGVLDVRIAAKGRTAHGSRPWEGENAIEKLMAVLNEIKSYFQKLQVKNAEYYPTVNIGTIAGGVATNQVPDSAEAKLDIRFPAVISSEEIMQHLEAIADNQKGVTLEKLIEASPSQVDLSLPPFQSFRQLAKELYKIEIGEVSAHGASDARYFGERKIPVLVISPEGGDIHSDKEWINLDDLVRFYTVMKAWVILQL